MSALNPRTCNWVVWFGVEPYALCGPYVVNARDKRAATVKAWQKHRDVSADGLLPSSRVKISVVRKANLKVTHA